MRYLPSIQAACLLLLAGCGAFGDEPFVGGDAQVTRVHLLALCEDACDAQAHGEQCSTEYYLEWCLENCRTIDGVIPDDCLAEAAAAFTCWAEQEWTCLDGSVLQSVQPRTLEDGVCEDVEQRYWYCA